MAKKFSELEAKMSQDAQKRSERRYRSLKIALRRWASLGKWKAHQHVGWFRKWNMTCDCALCQLQKSSDIELRRLKDERRNPHILESD